MVVAEKYRVPCLLWPLHNAAAGLHDMQPASRGPKAECQRHCYKWGPNAHTVHPMCSGHLFEVARPVDTACNQIEQVPLYSLGQPECITACIMCNCVQFSGRDGASFQ